MISDRKLSNGIRVVMEEMPQVNSVALGIWVKTGAVNETDRISGISHFVEHMMFKGTPSRDALKISADIDKIGGQMNAMTGKEATCYYVKCTSSHLKESADVLTDMLENSLFDKYEMNRERNVICEEIKMDNDDSEDFCHEKLINGIYKNSRLGHSITGTATSLMRINHDVMAGYVHDQYVRDSIVISVAGNFDPDEVCDYFEEKFSSLAKSKDELTPEDNIEYTPSYHSYVKDVKQAQLCLATRAINISDPRSYAFQILNNIMGGSMSSRMFQNIREMKGLAYSIYTAFSSFVDDGYFEISAGVSPENISGTIKGVKEELDRLRYTSVTTEELESSREQMKASYIFSQESTAARMHINGKNYLLAGHAFGYDEVMKGFNDVTIGDIDEVKELISDFSDYSAAVVSGSKVDIKRMMERG